MVSGGHGVDTAVVGVFLSQQGPCCTAIELDNSSASVGLDPGADACGRLGR